MADIVPPEKRSAMMRAVRSADTRPELAVRRLAHALGRRFRLHRRDLPGTPDLVFPRLGKVVFVHGCFWHGHACPRGARTPATRTAFWVAKLARNRARDAAALRALRRLGWRALVVWECEALARGRDRLAARLARFLDGVTGRAPAGMIAGGESPCVRSDPSS